MLIPYIQYPHGSIKWFLESSQGLLWLPSLQVSFAWGGLIILAISQYKPLQRYQWVLWVLLSAWGG